MTEEQKVAYEHLLRQGGDRMFREASAHFAGEGQLHGALQRLVQRGSALPTDCETCPMCKT